MKIQEKDLFHGAALTQIVEHKSFKALNRASERYGHYIINTDRPVFIKYSKKKGASWSFNFSADEVETINDAEENVHLCLVCGQTTVCALDRKETGKVLAFDSTAVQFITVTVPKGGSCHVHGTAGELGHTVPHNSFPDKLFPAKK